MTKARRVWDFIAARPFRSSLAVMLVVSTVGYIRQEQTINDAQETADKVAEIQADREADRITRAEESCERAVSVRDDNRAMWLFVLDLLAGGRLVPQVRAELDRRLPVLECDADNVPVPING